MRERESEGNVAHVVCGVWVVRVKKMRSEVNGDHSRVTLKGDRSVTTYAGKIMISFFYKA